MAAAAGGSFTEPLDLSAPNGVDTLQHVGGEMRGYIADRTEHWQESQRSAHRFSRTLRARPARFGESTDNARGGPKHDIEVGHNRLSRPWDVALPPAPSRTPSSGHSEQGW